MLTKITSLLLTFVFLVGCSTSDIIKNIEVALRLAILASNVVGVSTSPAVSGYLSAALGCISFASTELKSLDSSVIKSAKITSVCGSLTAPILPPGTPQEVANKLADVANAISDLLAGLPTPPGAANGSKAPPLPIFTQAEQERLTKVAIQANVYKAVVIERTTKK